MELSDLSSEEEATLEQLFRRAGIPHSDAPCGRSWSSISIHFEHQFEPWRTAAAVQRHLWKRSPRFARVKIPGNVPRLIRVNDTNKFVLLDHLVSAHIRSLFPGCAILECQPFRITRDADIEIEEDEADDLLKSVQQTLRQRRFGFGVRLEVSSAMSVPMIEVLRQSLQLEKQDVYSVEGPMNIPDLMALYKLDLPNAKDKPFEPSLRSFREGESIFDAIRHQDVLLHHPYESFMPVVDFFRSRSEGSERPRDQSHALSCRKRLADRSSAD